MEETQIDERLFVASVEKAMKIMELFDTSSGSLSMTELVNLGGLGKSATQRFVYTLFTLGYLRRDPISKAYSLSAKVFRFAHGMIGANSALERSKGLMTALAKETKETVSWAELDGDEIVMISNTPSAHLASISLSVGARFVALPASSGQVLLCNKNREELLKMIERLDADSRTRFGKQTPEGIMARLEQVRRDGFALTEKNLGEGSISISAPVLDYSGQVIAAINLSTLSSRFSLKTAFSELVPKVMAAAKAASST